MPRIKDKRFVTFNDGLMEVCVTKNRTITETKMSLRYGKKTVGYSKFYKAKIASVSIDKVVFVPMVSGISKMDMCIIDGEQYKIQMIQEKFDSSPPCLQLDLERNVPEFKDVRM